MALQDYSEGIPLGRDILRDIQDGTDRKNFILQVIICISVKYLVIS